MATVKRKRIRKPANGWYSMLLLLRYYTTAEIADAIDSVGIYVIDSVGRKIQANDGPPTDRKSKMYALCLLEMYYAESQDPGPEYSWEHERWESEPHPTYFFGWPANSLPDVFSGPRSAAKVQKQTAAHSAAGQKSDSVPPKPHFFVNGRKDSANYFAKQPLGVLEDFIQLHGFNVSAAAKSINVPRQNLEKVLKNLRSGKSPWSTSKG